MEETTKTRESETKTAGISGNSKEVTINFNIYENGVECRGVSSVVMPTIAHVMQMSGATAISLEAAILRIIYNTVTPDTNFYFEPTRRMIEIRLAQQRYDFAAGNYVIDAIKHVFMAEPKRANAGEIAPARPLNAYVDYTVDYWKTVVNEETLLEIDQQGGVCFINKRKYTVIGGICGADENDQKAKICAYRVEQRWKADITGVRSQDLADVIQAIALHCPEFNRDGAEPQGAEEIPSCPPDYCGTCLPGDCKHSGEGATG